MPRLNLTLTATRDTIYDTNYHGKLRGALWDALGAPYDDNHDRKGMPDLAFSSIHPWEHELQAGSQYQLLAASTDADLLGTLRDHLQMADRFRVGEMPFEVSAVESAPVDAGAPGTRGQVELLSGLYLELPDWVCEEYGIEPYPGDGGTYWAPEHGTEVIHGAIEATLQRHYETVYLDGAREPASGSDQPPGPAEMDGPLFDGAEYEKTYWVQFSPSPDHTRKVRLSKWTFDYDVRSDAHRKYLNFALHIGLGQRTGYGFGFGTLGAKQRPVLGSRAADVVGDGDKA